MKHARTLALGLALTMLAGSALAMGGRKRRKKKAVPAADSMAEGLKRVDMAKKAEAEGKDEMARRAFEQAAKHFLAATEATPEDPEAWNQLGFSRRKAGDLRGSLTAYSKALDLRPGYAEAIEYQAEAYLALKTYDRVMSAYKSLLGAGDTEAANTLLKACQEHVVERNAEGASGSVFETFRKWVHRRSKLATRMERPVSKAPTKGKRW
jgi:tetratricopeptide (TPR) repeat protein